MGDGRWKMEDGKWRMGDGSVREMHYMKCYMPYKPDENILLLSTKRDNGKNGGVELSLSILFVLRYLCG